MSKYSTPGGDGGALLGLPPLLPYSASLLHFAVLVAAIILNKANVAQDGGRARMVDTGEHRFLLDG
jgi:hypothetical protein